AEDGIRDFHVTGVQTCALPISRAKSLLRTAVFMAVKSLPTSPPNSSDLYANILFISHIQNPRAATPEAGKSLGGLVRSPENAPRSEERRVGKECGCRVAPEQ